MKPLRSTPPPFDCGKGGIAGFSALQPILQGQGPYTWVKADHLITNKPRDTDRKIPQAQNDIPHHPTSARGGNRTNLSLITQCRGGIAIPSNPTKPLGLTVIRTDSEQGSVYNNASGSHEVVPQLPLLLIQSINAVSQVPRLQDPHNGRRERKRRRIRHPHRRFPDPEHLQRRSHRAIFPPVWFLRTARLLRPHPLPALAGGL